MMEAIAKIFNDIENKHFTVCLVKKDESGDWFEIVCVDENGEVEDTTYGHSTKEGAINIAAALYGWGWGWEEIE